MYCGCVVTNHGQIASHWFVAGAGLNFGGAPTLLIVVIVLISPFRPGLINLQLVGSPTLYCPLR